MASSGKDGLHGLADDELRVMKYFAKTGGIPRRLSSCTKIRLLHS